MTTKFAHPLARALLQEIVHKERHDAAVTILSREQLTDTIVDAKFVAVTPGAARLYGFTRPEEMVGMWQSHTQELQDYQMSRAIGSARHCDPMLPSRYLTRLRQPRGTHVTVAKSVREILKQGVSYWVTELTPAHDVPHLPDLENIALPSTASRERVAFSGIICIAEIEALVRDTLDGNKMRPVQSGQSFRWEQMPLQPTSRTLGQRLRQAREVQGLSLRQAAASIRRADGRPISRQYLSNLEKGHRTPSLQVLQEIVSAFHLDMDLVSPVDNDILSATLRHVMPPSRALQDVLPVHKADDLPPATGTIVGRSPALGQLAASIHRVAATTAPVLITGETGVGKELVARALHVWSPRRTKPFIAVNCAAISAGLLESELFGHERGAFTGAERRHRGKFEQAHRGTLFLDEVASLPLPMQGALLRVLQEREFYRVGGNALIQVDVRVVAATNQDLRQMITARTFREDLFYRLDVVSLRVPPLRERRDDLRLLVQHFLEKYNKMYERQVYGFTADALEALHQYHWPGNVRELEHLIARLVATAFQTTIDLLLIQSALGL